MTRVTTSPDSGKAYFLTIGEDGRATDCTCMDRKVRTWKPECKHMSRFNEALIKAEAFLRLKARFDHRNLAAQERLRIEAVKPTRYAEAEIQRDLRRYQPRAFSLLR